MIRLKSLAVTPDAQLKKLNWNWMLGEDTLKYISTEVVVVKEFEAERYYEAGNELYDMFVQAGQYVLDNNLFEELGIPASMEEIIRYSWEDDRSLHLYGRFDFSGGIDGQPIKLIEFNADTATSLPETSIVQWAHLMANGLDESLQFNTLYEALVENFKRLKNLNSDLPPKLLLSTLKNFPEDDSNVQVLGEAAMEAGFKVQYEYIEDVEFSPEEGIFVKDEDGNFNQSFFWFKLVPWEYIAVDEPDLMLILNNIILSRKAVVINPPYSLLFQSKGILNILWKLFPNHRYLLETDVERLRLKESVEKVLLGREGSNVRILDKNGHVIKGLAGDYGDQKKIYQEYVEYVKDEKNLRYQAGVFFAHESCALGYRRGGSIIDNTAQFVGHIVG
jgi:glutathionylspermidine synthase